MTDLESPADSSTNSQTTSVSPKRDVSTRLLLSAIGVAVFATALFGFVLVRHFDQRSTPNILRASGIPSSIPTSLANLMALSPVPNHPAPNFTLVDQNHHTLSLASFKGRSVVLEFMDSHCVDICPIVSQEFVNAYHDLGKSASRVVFIAVNVNPFHTGVSDVAAFSREHQLTTIPTWHFFTGPTSVLKTVWHNYGVLVVARNPKTDVIHTSIVFFIDPQGRERFIGAPTDQHTAKGTAFLPGNQLVLWGHGIADVARQMNR